MALDPTWRLGFALSYESLNTSTGNRAHSDGDRLEGGIVLKNRWGNTTLAAAAFGGYGWFDTTRAIGLDGIATAKGEQDIAFGGLHVRLGQIFSQSGWYLKPMLDLNVTYVDYGGFRETGAGPANLTVEGDSQWVFSASPALELGGDYRVETTLYRPFVRVGATVFSDTNFALTSSFLSAPAGVTPFTVHSRFDDVFLDVSAGLDVIAIDGLTVKVNYDGRFAEHTEIHAGGAKLGMRF